MSIEKEVLARIIPSEEEEKLIQKTVSQVKTRIEEVADQLEIDIEPMLVGSVAKGTHLSNPDIDLFVLFPTTTNREDLERHGLTIGKTVLPSGQERYAEHPYILGNFNDFDVEIVPCYKVEDSNKKISAVDRTPFHTRYIMDNLKEPQKNQVRLLKQFLKGIGVYGAEAEVEGFSGYLCELLIQKYGTFHEVLTQAKKWKRGIMIKLNDKDSAKFTDPLVVIDPVDPNRNVASALSEDNFSVFIHACKEYTNEPKIEFFFPGKLKPLTLDRIQKAFETRSTALIALTFKAPDLIPDILHPQLKKGMRVINQLFDRNGFKVLDSNYFVNENVMLLFELEIFELPNVVTHKGPPVSHSNVPDFFEKWTKSPNLIAGPYIKKGSWYVDIKRDYKDARALLQNKISTLNLGKNVTKMVKENYMILIEEEIIKPKYAQWLTRFLDKRFAWEY
jgi:tRNA nucleotidyltransferase (CCA-adding enzyme)